MAAAHAACIGGSVHLVTACEVRFCTEYAFFSVKDLDLVITADVGTLQRLPNFVGYGNAVELALTGIAAKSPLAVTGTKSVLLRSGDVTVDQGLEYVATWNSGVLLSDDLDEACSCQALMAPPLFLDLLSQASHRLRGLIGGTCHK